MHQSGHTPVLSHSDRERRLQKAAGWEEDQILLREVSPVDSPVLLNLLLPSTRPRTRFGHFLLTHLSPSALGAV